jgi:hypothetical protein
MTTFVADPGLVARCELYCGACQAYLDRRCRGCRSNESCTWCRAGSCCEARGLFSCAECKDYDDVRACPRFNGFMPRVLSLVLRADRAACIDRIRAGGYQSFAAQMAAGGMHVLPRR